MVLSGLLTNKPLLATIHLPTIENLPTIHSQSCTIRMACSARYLVAHVYWMLNKNKQTRSTNPKSEGFLEEIGKNVSSYFL